MEEELKKFKGLASAYEVASCSTLSGTYLAECLLCDPDFARELADVDTALLCLQSRIDHSRMQPILSKLFGQLSALKAVEDWDQALSEIFTFARFESLGILHSIGWPSEFAGDPPFDFAIDIQENILAGDVKPANGNGYRLLEANLCKCVSEQAAQSGIADPRLIIRYSGPLTQETVGPNLRLAISN